jgi:hypothetical protein
MGDTICLMRFGVTHWELLSIPLGLPQLKPDLQLVQLTFEKEYKKNNIKE